MEKPAKKVPSFSVKHKQTVVAEYKYKGNGAHIRILAVNPPWNACDSLMFHLKPAKKNGKPLAFYMRHDEAILMAQLLLKAVYDTTTMYEFTPPKPRA